MDEDGKPYDGQFRGMRNIRRLADIPDRRQREAVERGLELGLEAAPSVNDRTISTFARGQQPAFAGINTFRKAPYLEDVHEIGRHEVAVLGAPFDMGTTYRAGCRFGPQAIRRISALYDSYSVELAVDLEEELDLVDLGDVFVIPSNIEKSFDQIDRAVSYIVGEGVFPVVLGGDHSITLAELRALHRRHGPLALVHLDAHGDTWHEYFGQRYYHGTTFRRAAEEGVIDPSASVQAGMRGSLYGPGDISAARELGFTVLSTRELRELGAPAFGDLVRSRVGGRPAFLSFDVDFCDPAFAPGTGTPEIGGPTTTEALEFVRALRGVGLAGCDVVEVAPPYDSPGQPTALLGATIAWEAICLHARAHAAVAEARG
jgi:agmatinase